MLLLLVCFLASTLGHVLFLFLIAAVIAFLLNPLVRDLQRLRLRRGLAVALVFLLFASAAGRRCSARHRRGRSDPFRVDRIENYFTVNGPGGQTGAEHDIDRLQLWLNTHHLERIKVKKSLDQLGGLLGAGTSRLHPGALSLRKGRGVRDHPRCSASS